MKRTVFFAAELFFILAIISTCQQSEKAANIESFGAECNPTGDPIGGFIGYSRHVTKKDYVVNTLDELLAALKKVKKGEVVYVDDDAEIDFTEFAEYDQVLIPAGVTLASGRGSIDKDGNVSYGALLYTNGFDTGFDNGLFITAGDSVRITGLRLKGPDPVKHVFSYGLPNSDCITVYHSFTEIDNCEIWAWSHAAIEMIKGSYVYIHHNFIHHNRRDGLGYGAGTGGASALIEANIFASNRHSVSGSGEKGSTYEACYNILYEDPEHTAHVFDMHGGTDLRDGTTRAGSYMNIHHNTVYGARQRPIVIRGIPEKESEFHHNWFVDYKPGTAVAQVYAHGNMKIFQNAYGPDKVVVASEEPIDYLKNRAVKKPSTTKSKISDTKNKKMEMVLIKGGTFEMGDVFGDGRKDEKPVHKVTVSDFYMGRYEVTQKEWKEVMGQDSNPSERKGDYLPVECLRWIDAINFCNKKSEMEGLEPCYVFEDIVESQAKAAYGTDNTTCNFNANGYRLPTEAEWEYAAREGGKKVRFGNGENIADPLKINFLSLERYKKPYSIAGKYRARIVEVGSFPPNDFGLYDMSGNVWEWCWDTYKKDYYKESPVNNPKGSANSIERVLRGGSAGSSPEFVRTTYRYHLNAWYSDGTLGFRYVRKKD